MHIKLQKPNGKHDKITDQPTESKKLDPSMSRKGLTEEHMHRLF